VLNTQADERTGEYAAIILPETPAEGKEEPEPMAVYAGRYAGLHCHTNPLHCILFCCDRPLLGVLFSSLIYQQYCLYNTLSISMSVSSHTSSVKPSSAKASLASTLLLSSNGESFSAGHSPVSEQDDTHEEECPYAASTKAIALIVSTFIITFVNRRCL